MDYVLTYTRSMHGPNLQVIRRHWYKCTQMHIQTHTRTNIRPCAAHTNVATLTQTKRTSGGSLLSSRLHAIDTDCRRRTSVVYRLAWGERRVCNSVSVCHSCFIYIHLCMHTESSEHQIYCRFFFHITRQ